MNDTQKIARMTTDEMILYLQKSPNYSDQVIQALKTAVLDNYEDEGKISYWLWVHDFNANLINLRVKDTSNGSDSYYKGFVGEAKKTGDITPICKKISSADKQHINILSRDLFLDLLDRPDLIKDLTRGILLSSGRSLFMGSFVSNCHLIAASFIIIPILLEEKAFDSNQRDILADNLSRMFYGCNLIRIVEHIPYEHKFHNLLLYYLRLQRHVELVDYLVEKYGEDEDF